MNLGKSNSYYFSLLHVDYVSLTSSWNYKNVISPYCRIYFIDKGEGMIATADGNFKLEPGFMYIIPSFTLCHLSCPSSLGQYFIHFFEEASNSMSLFQNSRIPQKLKVSEQDILLIKRLLKLNPGRGIFTSDNPRVYEKHKYYQGYQELNLSQSTSTSLETQAVLMLLVARFLCSKNKHEQPIAPAVSSKILQAISFIQLNLKKQLSVKALSHNANLHPDYFSRLFLQHTGIRPMAYIHEKRIERAQYLLTTTNLSIAEVALETGFESLPYFSRLFKPKP